MVPPFYKATHPEIFDIFKYKYVLNVTSFCLIQAVEALA